MKKSAVSCRYSVVSLGSNEGLAFSALTSVAACWMIKKYAVLKPRLMSYQRTLNAYLCSSGKMPVKKLTADH